MSKSKNKNDAAINEYIGLHAKPFSHVIVCGALLIFLLYYSLSHYTSLSRYTEDDGNKKSIRTRSHPWTKETIVLASKNRIPAIGYGTCCRSSAKGAAIYESTKLYIKHGGRHIDTAQAYGNHVEIGRAIRDSGVSRKDLWLTSKIGVGKVRGKKETLKAVAAVLKEMRIEYLDLMLIHSPKTGKKNTIQIWEGLVEAKKKGLVRAIGVSNFNKLEILDLKEATGEMPELNQIQFHPWTPKEWKDLVKWQQSNGIATTAYTSLGGSRFDQSSSIPIISKLSSKYDVTETQILLRWALQQNVIVIPGSSNEEHIRQNIDIPSFVLTPQEMLEVEVSTAPEEWFDRKRGPAKLKGEEAIMPWITKRKLLDEALDLP